MSNHLLGESQSYNWLIYVAYLLSSSRILSWLVKLTMVSYKLSKRIPLLMGACDFRRNLSTATHGIMREADLSALFSISNSIYNEPKSSAIMSIRCMFGPNWVCFEQDRPGTETPWICSQTRGTKQAAPHGCSQSWITAVCRSIIEDWLQTIARQVGGSPRYYPSVNTMKCPMP